MSISLADALEKVELEPGRTYECEVRGRHVELRVFDEPPPVRNHLPFATTPGLHEDDIRLDPWCELSSPRELKRVPSKLIDHIPFDIPEIPQDEGDRLDAWCELPSPKPLSRVIPRPIARHPFDIPEIPHEESE